jgi:hypothetical protein
MRRVQTGERRKKMNGKNGVDLSRWDGAIKSVIARKTQADKFGVRSVSRLEPVTRGYANSGTKKARRLLLEALGERRDIITHVMGVQGK